MLKINECIKKVAMGWLTKEPRRTELPLCDFERIQYEIRPCDVLLIEGRSRVSEKIKLITQSRWSHSALYIGRIHDIADPSLRAIIKHHFKGNRNDQLLIEGMLGRGVIITPLSYYQQDHIRICRPEGISRSDAQKVIEYAIKRLGKDYNIRQTLDLFRYMYPWSFLPRRWRSSLFKYKPGESTHEICSSMIAEAFNCVKFPITPLLKKTDTGHGVELIPRNPLLTTPADFDYSPYFEVIKYPVFGLAAAAVYRDLPWNETGAISDDKDQIYIPEVPANTKEQAMDSAQNTATEGNEFELIPDDIQHNSEVDMAEDKNTSKEAKSNADKTSEVKND